MKGGSLPIGLLDLVYARTNALALSSRKAPSVLGSALHARLAHSVAAARTTQDAPAYETSDRSLYAPLHARQAARKGSFATPVPRTGLKLEERVLALKNAIYTEESGLDIPTYSERELVNLYEDLLALPATALPEENNGETPDYEAVVQDVYHRLFQADTSAMVSPSPAPFAQKLMRLRDGSSDSSQSLFTSRLERAQDLSVPIHLACISRIDQVLTSMEAVQTMLGTSKEPQPVQASLLTSEEWTALAGYCRQSHDPGAMEQVVDLMRRIGTPDSEPIADELISDFANLADVAEVERLVQKYGADSPTERQRYCLAKVHLQALRTTDFPTQALDVLHAFESRGLPAPQKAYSKVISHLFSMKRTASHAHAWDLFSNMRFAAHPDPDVKLYTKMIRACASHMLSRRGEPERALDLFTEMTVDKKIPPTAEAYQATILACARSGEKNYINQAFRLAKQMLDAHRDAHGASPFFPDRKLYTSLLEGCKRLGDVTRVRWLLAEVVKEHRMKVERGDADAVEMAVSEEIMVHVFHAYAAYFPPFRREQTVLADEASTTATSAESTDSDSPPPAIGSDAEGQPSVPVTTRSSFPVLAPQTHADTLREVDTLFSRILEERKLRDTDPTLSFAHVDLSTHLLNAYLATNYIHAPPGRGLELFLTLFEELGVPRNARAYVDALEHCQFPRKVDRPMTMKYAEQVWKMWEPVETAWRLQKEDSPQWTARLVERAYVAMSRVYAICGHLDSAMKLIKQFASYYPPTIIREPSPEGIPLLRAHKPLVRMTSDPLIPDDAVPPLLSYPELEVLHHRLVAANRPDDIAYIKWLCKSYEGSLRMRRDKALGAPPRYKKKDAPAAVEAPSRTFGYKRLASRT